MLRASGRDTCSACHRRQRLPKMIVPKKPEAPILPGEDGEIQVKYDTKRVNPIRKTITVTSNADTPTVALKIKGNVIDPSKTNILKPTTKSVVEK